MSPAKKQKTDHPFEALQPARCGPEVTPWAEDMVDFTSSTTDQPADVRREQALEVLRHPRMLDKYWPRLLDIVKLLEANEGTKSFETLLHWDLLKQRKMSVLFYGAQYSGKSQLIRALSDHEKAIPLPGHERTECGFDGIPCPCPSGVNMIDTKGFEWPGTEPPKSDKDAHEEWAFWIKGFETRVANLSKRIRVENSADNRPLAVVVCVGAPRNPPDTAQLKRLLTVSHELLVPTFLVLTNIFAVDGDVREDRKAHYKALIDSIPPNERARNNRVNFVAVNSVDFVADTRKTHKSEGIPEFVTTLIQNLDPMDGLTFARKVDKTWFRSSAPRSLSDEEKRAITDSILGAC